MSTDKRIAELQEVARESGLTLPYPPDYILFLEDNGRIVDLESGEVLYSVPVATPTRHAQAIVHLLCGRGE